MALSVYPPIIARKQLGKECCSLKRNAGRVVFYAVGVMSSKVI
jgi:hypothetical protein